MTDRLRRLAAQAKVILKAAPTWLTAAAVVLTVLNDEIGGLLPEGAAETFGTIVVTAGAWIGAAINIIRRVTPVLPEERGVLPNT